MATTTATITLSSTDLLSDELALTTTATLTTAGTATGITQSSGLGRKKLASGDAQYTLFDGNDYAADGAHKLYLKNTSTTPGQYFAIDINSERMGKLYAGDCAFFPWDENASTYEIKIDTSAGDMLIEYMHNTGE